MNSNGYNVIDENRPRRRRIKVNVVSKVCTAIIILKLLDVIAAQPLILLFGVAVGALLFAVKFLVKGC